MYVRMYIDAHHVTYSPIRKDLQNNVNKVTHKPDYDNYYNN